MGEPQNRNDVVAGKLAVAAGFCTQKLVDAAAKAIEQLTAQGTSLSLPHVLLKQKSITAMQYRLLNMGLRYEMNRDEDMAFARFLVKNKYLNEAKIKEVLGEQDPYYREGKEFPRLADVLEEGNYLPKDQIDKLRKMIGSFGAAMKHAAAAGVGREKAPPVVGLPAASKTTIRSDSLTMDHCRVNVRKNVVKGPDGKERKVYALAVDGQLDAHTFAEFDRFLEMLMDKERYYLVVEMAKLDYISSAGIGVLAGTARKARDMGGDVRLAAVPDGVMKVLSLVGFEKLMQIYGTAQEAIDSFKQDS